MNKLEMTLAIIKPHAVKHPYVFDNIRKRIKEEFQIVNSREMVLSTDVAEQFYAEHRSKFFYNRLISFMTSHLYSYESTDVTNDYRGPSVAMILSGENAIQKWRQMMGPTKVFKAILTHPDTIRGLYGLTDTRNACHGSDGEESAMREISIMFPDFNIHEWRKKQLENQ